MSSITEADLFACIEALPPLALLGLSLLRPVIPLTVSVLSSEIAHVQTFLGSFSPETPYSLVMLGVQIYTEPYTRRTLLGSYMTVSSTSFCHSMMQLKSTLVILRVLPVAEI